MLALFRVKFPNHRDFKNLDENDRQAVPKWWSNARSQAIKAIDKYQKSLGGNYTFGQTDCHPIYPDNDKGDLGRALLDFYAKIDLLSIARKLFTEVADMQGNPTKSVGNLQKRLWMILTFLAASRPGEIKFNDMANWQFHHFFNVLDIKWSELKTMTTYAMPMHASNWHFLLDFWHALGCF